MDGNGNGNDNDETLRKIQETMSLAEINEQELCRNIWDFMRNFPEERGSNLLASDLIVDALERGAAANSTANRDLFDITSILSDAFIDFFRANGRELRANELPFFTVMLTSEEKETLRNGQQVTNHNVQRASESQSGTIHSVYQRFNADFETFDPNYNGLQDVFQNVDNLCFRCFFDRSFDNIREVSSNEDRYIENVQMFFLARCINRMLRRSNYEMVVPANSDPDVKVNSIKPDKTLFIGEAESTENLPLTPPTAQLSKQLLDHGFATALSRVTYQGDEGRILNQFAATLRERLLVPDGKIKESEVHVYVPSTQLSEKARHILANQNDGELNKSYRGVREAFGAGQINDENSLHLWDATMKACIKSIELKKKYTMVLSNRVVWFIHLRESDGNRGVIGISKGLAVGSKCFIRDFARYAAMVQRGYEQGSTSEDEKSTSSTVHMPMGVDDEEGNGGSKDNRDVIYSHSSSIMTDQEQMRWQRALWSPVCRNAGKTMKKDLCRGIIPTTTSSRKYTPTADISHCLKRAKIDATTHDNDNDNDNANANTVITDNVDDTSWSLTKAEQDELLDIDEYGYIPHLSQIKTIHSTLGYGRCGKVKSIQFFGYQVAMKEFKLQLDHDERDYYDVFKHEREMYIHTKSLWGAHVPALIFHNPCRSCPSLGMQLGEPIEEDDIEKWTQEDRDKLEETLEKLKELGLEQTDRRGWNFVKLRKGDTEYVAVVDMESVDFIGNR